MSAHCRPGRRHQVPSLLMAATPWTGQLLNSWWSWPSWEAHLGETPSPKSPAPLTWLPGAPGRVSISTVVQGGAAGEPSRRLGREMGGKGWVPAATRSSAGLRPFSQGPWREDTLEVQAEEPVVGGVGVGTEVRSLGLQEACPPHPSGSGVGRAVLRLGAAAPPYSQGRPRPTPAA